MKKLLIIMGDLATGKSTFAGILSKRYDTVAFSKDSIKEVLGDSIGFSNREENLKLSKATVELMVYIFSRFGKQGKNLILEANFHASELERLHQIAHENDYQVLVLVLRGDAAILHKRYINRIQNENRHPVHLSTTLDVFEDFREYTERLRGEGIPEGAICLNADDFSYQTDSETLETIDAFMEDF